MDGFSLTSILFGIFLAAMMLASYVALRRYRSRRLLMQRVAELESLSGAGRAIVAAELNPDALCELIATETSKVIDNQTFQIGLFEDGFYIIRYWRLNGRAQPVPQKYDLISGGGIVKWIREAKHPLLVKDFEKEMEKLPAQPRYISDTPPRSALFIPLISGEEVIGVVAAQSHKPNQFDEEDLRRLMILANQSAAAISHARLFVQAQKRAAQLELVSEIGLEINRVQSRSELFAKVVELTAVTFGFHLVSIFGWDEEAERLVLQASNLEELMGHQLQIEPNEGLVGTAVAARQTVISNDTNNDVRYVTRIEYLEKDTHAELAVPLLVDDNLLGVLDVQSQSTGFFTEVEKTTLEALAAEIAIAIDKLQQLARQRQQAWLTTAQLQVAEAIGRSEAVDEMLTAVTRLAPILMGASFCAMLLWQEEMGYYQGVSLYGGDHDQQEKFSQLYLPIGAWSALDAVHVGLERLTTHRVQPWLLTAVNEVEEPPQKVTLQPITLNEQPLGVILIEDLESNKHSGEIPSRHDELLENIANQMANGLEMFNLRIAQQEEAWVNTALFQVAAAVNSLTDLNEILSTIIRLVPLLVGVESTLILIWNKERNLFNTGPSYGLDEMGRGLLETLEMSHDELVDLIPNLQANKQQMTGNYFHVKLPDWLEKVLSTSSAYAFPLSARGQLVGVMFVGRNGSLSHRHINILTGVAHQAATAVVNNHLYQEAAERDRLEQELTVAREIQASLIPDGSPEIPGCDVASYWEAARQVSGDFYDFLELADNKWGIIIADVADKGVPAALFMALSRTILRTIAFNRVDPADTLIRANEIIDNDAQSDLFVTVFYAVWDPSKEILAYANGGHNPPLHFTRNGKSQLLAANGIALGVLPDINIECRSIDFKPGDTLVFYTDGVTEAMNEDYDEFGMSRLQMAVNSTRKRSASNIANAITTAIDVHAGGTPQFDDITLIVMKRV